MAEQSRENNFNMLRAIAAFLVLAGHAYILNGGGAPLIWGHEIQAIGVYILFILGGYLIATSWSLDHSVVKYTVKRITRLWPPLVVVVLITIFIVGPIVTVLPLSDYFSSCWDYANNILFKPIYYLAGCFSDNPYANAANGSLWTMPVELAFYALVPIIITLMSIKKDPRFADAFIIILIAVVIIVNYYTLTHGVSYGYYGTDWVAGFHLLPLYLMGILYTRDRMKKLLSLPAAVVLMLLLTGISISYPAANVLVIIVLPYIVFSFAFAPSKMKDFSKKYEITYGVYLYGFLIQQTVMHFLVEWGITMKPVEFLAVTALLTIPMGYFSCIFVEQPVRKLTMKLLKKWDERKSHRQEAS